MANSEAAGALALDVVLAGCQENADRETTLKRLAALFRKDVATIEKILARGRFVVKSDVDAELAGKYKASIEKAGGICELVDKSLSLEPLPASPAPASAPATPVPTPAIHDHEEPSPYRVPGAPLQDEVMVYCRNCGSKIPEYAERCPNCHHPQGIGHPKSKIKAALLAFFFGGFGIHRMYLGQWWAIFYILFWATLIPSVVSVVEAIVFLATPQERWQRKYDNVQSNRVMMVVIAIAGFFLAIMVLGIVSAITLPAYDVYVKKSKVVSALPLIHDTQNTVSAFIQHTHSYPARNIDAGLPKNISSAVVQSLTLGEDSHMTVTFRETVIRGEDRTLEWAPATDHGSISWRCTGGSMPARYRPPECRNGAVTSSGAAATHELRSTDNSLSLRVPSALKDDPYLSSTALIRASNRADKTFLIVLAESRKDFTDGFDAEQYMKLLIPSIHEHMQETHLVGEENALQIDHKPARQVALAGVSKGLKITYLLTVVEGEKTFYQVISWTSSPDFERKRSEFESIARSFREN